MPVVLITGHFNVLHPGHIRLFKFARELGDRLVVGVESDRLAGAAAHVREALRLEGVQSNTYVDEAFLFDSSIEEVIASLRPSFVVKGREHEGRLNVESEALAKYGGILLFSSGDAVFSSSDLLRKEISSTDHALVLLPKAYISRNQLNVESQVECINKFKSLGVIVVGDLIVDEYIACQPLGMSQEDPTIVVSPIESKKFIGGAGIVAAHAAGLGAKVNFFSVTGQDPMREFSQKQLAEYGVSAHLLVDEARPTTLKQRFRAQGKSLLRVSHLHQDSISKTLQQELLAALQEKLPDADLLVFSDFNYGCLPQYLVDEVIRLAKKEGVLVAADSQSSSQVGDIARFRGVDLITPTEHEARISMKNQEDGVVVLAEGLRSLAEAKHVLLKMGDEGLLVQSLSDGEEGIYTDQVPALNGAPKDVAGAGDSLLISSAMAMAVGASIWEMGLIGSLAAAVQVGRVGNKPLSANELIESLTV